MINLKKIKTPVWFCLILIFAAGLRLYGLQTAGFDYDQEYAANFAYRVVQEYPIQMIGQNLSVGGLFMGPFYFYFLTPFFIAANLHPIGGVFGSITLGLITIAAYFYIFKSVFGLKAAIIASLLRASLSSFLGADLAMTPAFSADLPALVTWFCFYKYWNNRLNYLIPLSFLFGLYTSYHPILFPFYLVFLIILAFKRSLPNWKILILSLFALFIPLLPLIRFEYHHDFLEIKRLFSLGSENGDPVNTLNYSRLAWLLNASFFNPIYTFFGIYSQDFVSTVGKTWGILFYLPLFILIFLRRNFWKDPFHKIVFLSTYALFITYYFFLPISLTEYYLLGTSTLFFIYAVASFSQVKSKLVIFMVITALICINLYQWHQQVTRNDSMTLHDKEQIVAKIKASTGENEDFFVSFITKPGYNFGYPYLFKIYNRIPSNDPQPRTFNIVSPKSMVGDKFDFESGDIGLILPK